MEWLILIAVILIAGIAAIVKVFLHGGDIRDLQQRIAALTETVAALNRRLERLEKSGRAATPTMEKTVALAASPVPITAKPEADSAPETGSGSAAIDAPEPVAPAAASAPAVPSEEKADWETRIGKRWLTWSGVLLLVIAVGFLVKYAYEQNWIGPWAQVGVGLAVGCGLCVLGDRQIRVGGMRALGQGVLGLGLALVYLTSFGAFALFKLPAFSQAGTLGFLGLTAAAGIFLSNRHDSMPVCILSALGGYLAPSLVATGAPPPLNWFFTYTLLVNLGVIAIAILRTWPVMPLLAFAGTASHFYGWYRGFYTPGYSNAVVVWAVIFHFVFLLLPALPLIRGARAGIWQWLLPVVNAVATLWVVWTRLIDRHPLALLLTLLAIAAGHLAIGMANRNATDAKAASGMYLSLGLAITGIAPLAYFGAEASLACWLALGLLLVEAGGRLRARLFLYFGYANLGVGLFWCLFHFMPAYNGAADPIAERILLGLRTTPAVDFLTLRYGSVEGYLGTLFSLRYFWTRLLCPAAFGVCALLLRRWRERVGQAAVGRFFAVAGVFVAIVFVQHDLNPWLYLTAPAGAETFTRSSALVPLWCVGALAVASAAWRWKSPRVGYCALALLLPAALLAGFDIFGNRAQPGDSFFLNRGYAAGMCLALSAMAVAWMFGGPRRALHVALAGYVLIVVQHFELWKMLRANATPPYSLNVILAFLWNAGALAYAVSGLRLRNRWFAAALIPALLAAAALCMVLYNHNPHSPYALFFNLRFATSFATVAIAFLAAYLAGREGGSPDGGGLIALGANGRNALHTFAAALGLAVLTLECHWWCLNRFGDGADGRHLARMSVSIVWAVYSIALLVVGFAVRIRAWRLAGLVLFGLTGARVVLFDLSHLDQLARIFSFMALGLMLMFASYLYHKLEKRLRDKEA